MLKTASTLALVPATLLVALLSASPARAQLNRTFVSGAGSDHNSCSFSTPCRTFQTAFNATLAGGEIDVLNPADYGPLTITNAISIEGHGFAGIGVANGNGITINAGEKDAVNLSGLIIEGNGTGSEAIQYLFGRLLTIKIVSSETSKMTALPFSPARVVFGSWIRSCRPFSLTPPASTCSPGDRRWSPAPSRERRFTTL
jgi:hypothetical protein